MRKRREVTKEGFLELVVELPSDHKALRQFCVIPRPAASALPGRLKNAVCILNFENLSVTVLLKV